MIPGAGTNIYVYVGDNPVSLIDPLGLAGLPSKFVILSADTENIGTYSVYVYQLEDAQGNALTGPGYSWEENISPNTGFTSNGRFVSMTNGMAYDLVGWFPPAIPPQNADFVTTQTFTVRHHGKYCHLTTDFRHENKSINGTVTITVTVIKP